MGDEREDSFPFNSEPNENLYGSENQKENCPHDHIPLNLKGNGDTVLSVWYLHGPIEGPLETPSTITVLSYLEV